VVEKVNSENMDDINKHPLENLEGVPKLTDLQRTENKNQLYIYYVTNVNDRDDNICNIDSRRALSF